MKKSKKNSVQKYLTQKKIILPQKKYFSKKKIIKKNFYAKKDSMKICFNHFSLFYGFNIKLFLNEKKLPL